MIEEGEIKYLKSGEFVHMAPSESEIEMWRDLFRATHENSDPCDPMFDPLNKEERALYEALTQRIYAQIFMIGYTATESAKEEDDEDS